MNGRRIIGHGGDTNYFHSELGLLEEEKRRVLRLRQHRAARRHWCRGTSPAPSWTTTSRRSCPRSSPRPTSPRGPPSTPGTTARSAIPTPGTRRSSACWEGRPSPDQPTTRSSSPDCSGTVAQYVEVAPAVFREVGRRPHGRVRRGRRGPGRGHGRPVRLHSLLQAALVRGLALPLHAARALHPALRDRRGLGAADTGSATRRGRSRRAGRASTSAPWEPSTWSSSWPSRRSWRPAWRTSSSRRPRASTPC